MSISYKFEVVSVDESARCMEVVYTADGKPTMRISARLPYEGESLEAIVRMYAPLRYWEEMTLRQQPVAPGTGGVITEAPESARSIAYSRRAALLSASDWTQLPDAPLSAEKKSEWAAYRQSLRDLSSQPGFPDLTPWPASPDAIKQSEIPVSQP